MSATQGSKVAKPRCGLCGKTGKLRQTECCGNWICDDHDKYVLFSYARNSCNRNHDRYTLCAFHHNEGHAGHWKDCKQCREAFEIEIFVWYGTNEYNFEKLENPPAFEPTKCSTCGKVIHLGTDGYSQLGDQKWCDTCGMKRLESSGVARARRAAGKTRAPGRKRRTPAGEGA